jgi:hypothetical protein
MADMKTGSREKFPAVPVDFSAKIRYIFTDTIYLDITQAHLKGEGQR